MTITEAYEKIKNSPELKKKAAEAAKNGKIEEFLKENGFDITVDQIKDFTANSKNRELSKEELDMASGGGCDDECGPNAAWSIITLLVGCAVSSYKNDGAKDIVCEGAEFVK